MPDMFLVKAKGTWRRTNSRLKKAANLINRIEVEMFYNPML